MTSTKGALPILQTIRLILRQLVPEDEHEIFVLRSDAGINKYLDRPLSNSLEDAGNFINKINGYIADGSSYYWAILLEGQEKLVGTICLFGFSNDKTSCEIGYELLPAFQGRGIMREAVDKVIAYALQELGVKKIEAYLHRDNQPSVKLLEKHAFICSNTQVPGEPDLLCYYLDAAV